MLSNGSKIWFKTGELRNLPGIIESYSGEGYYLVRDEKGILRYIYELDIIE